MCTKADLDDHDSLAGAINAAEAAVPETTVLAVSAITGAGLDDLRAELVVRTAVFDGESTFDDIIELGAECRFGDGALPAARLQSWRRLRQEAASAGRRAARQFRRIAREAQRMKRLI